MIQNLYKNPKHRKGEMTFLFRIKSVSIFLWLIWSEALKTLCIIQLDEMIHVKSEIFILTHQPCTFTLPIYLIYFYMIVYLNA